MAVCVNSCLSITFKIFWALYLWLQILFSIIINLLYSSICLFLSECYTCLFQRKRCFSQYHKYLVRGRNRPYFLEYESDSMKMSNFIIDNNSVMLRGSVFQQILIIFMVTQCACISQNLVRYTYETDFNQELIRNNEKELTLTLTYFSAIANEARSNSLQYTFDHSLNFFLNK